MNKQKTVWFLGGVLLVIVAGASFFAGTYYQKKQRPNLTFNQQFGGRNGNPTNSQMNNRGGFRPVNGEILSADDKSITVKLTDGSSKIIFLSDKTQITTATASAKTDLKTGVKVTVMGTENNDGSVSAQNILLN